MTLGRALIEREKTVLSRSLATFQKTFAQSDAFDDVEALLAVGESKSDKALMQSELAAWTMLANQMLNLDEVLNK